MSIRDHYITKISTKRLTSVGGTDKETFQTHLEDIPCRIEPQGEEPIMLGDGAFYNLFKMCCDNVDIKEGDEITDSEGKVYITKGVSVCRGSSNAVHHLEILLALPR